MMRKRRRKNDDKKIIKRARGLMMTSQGRKIIVATVNRTRGLKMTVSLQSCALPTELLRRDILACGNIYKTCTVVTYIPSITQPVHQCMQCSPTNVRNKNWWSNAEKDGVECKCERQEVESGEKVHCLLQEGWNSSRINNFNIDFCRLGYVEQERWCTWTWKSDHYLWPKVTKGCKQP